ncbi:hypothetical protein J3U87_22085 [Sulfidibacter corallicola]|uniref:Uncharacterized protein n=1 Tax=Sulfidibacter corallicola TaxID=2818388 RepID=A0A8A4THP1_SULCO|nr:hypothetical protein J3U87_22085 [Sulfidibacter corallicola]
MLIKIGQKGKRGADEFTLHLATPDGLKDQNSSDEIHGLILAQPPLVVMKAYYFEELWRWLVQIVESCESETWLSSVDKLKRYFCWEYEGFEL